MQARVDYVHPRMIYDFGNISHLKNYLQLDKSITKLIITAHIQDGIAAVEKQKRIKSLNMESPQPYTSEC